MIGRRVAVKSILVSAMLWSFIGSDTLLAADYKPPITPDEAQSLPVQELARRVLGDLGSAIVIDVDRPSWGPRPMPVAPVSWPPPGPPKIEQLIFYGRPHVTGSQFGLCGADVITVNYEEHNVPRVLAQERYGVEYPLEKWPSTWSYDQSDRVCKAARDVKQYFPAPDGESAYEIARQFSFIARAARSGTLPFRVACTGLVEACKTRSKKLLASLSTQEIADAKEINCPSGTRRYGTCFELKVCGPNNIYNHDCDGSYRNITIVGSDYLKSLSIKSVTIEWVTVIY